MSPAEDDETRLPRVHLQKDGRLARRQVDSRGATRLPLEGGQCCVAHRGHIAQRALGASVLENPARPSDFRAFDHRGHDLSARTARRGQHVGPHLGLDENADRAPAREPHLPGTLVGDAERHQLRRAPADGIGNLQCRGPLDAAARHRSGDGAVLRCEHRDAGRVGRGAPHADDDRSAARQSGGGQALVVGQ